jgi:hypothetical protein
MGPHCPSPEVQCGHLSAGVAISYATVANVGFHLAGIPPEPQAAEKIALLALAVNEFVISFLKHETVKTGSGGLSAGTTQTHPSATGVRTSPFHQIAPSGKSTLVPVPAVSPAVSSRLRYARRPMRP